MTQKQLEELKRYEQELKDDPKAECGSCKNCNRKIRKKLRRCPYCGTLNPTVTLKEIFITIAGVIIVMWIFTYFSKM